MAKKQENIQEKPSGICRDHFHPVISKKTDFKLFVTLIILIFGTIASSYKILDIKIETRIKDVKSDIKTDIKDIKTDIRETRTVITEILRRLPK